MSKQCFMSSRGIRNYVINMRTLLTWEKQLDAQEVQITPMPQVNISRREAKPCWAASTQRSPLCARSLEAGLSCDWSGPSSGCACLCFQLPLEFTAGSSEAAAPRWTTCGTKARVVGNRELHGKNLRERCSRSFRKGKQKVEVKKENGGAEVGGQTGQTLQCYCKKTKTQRVSKLAWTGKKGMLKQKLGVSTGHERA